MPTIDVRDTTIYYEQAGQGPSLLFIHGMCGNAMVWADQVGRLADRFECVTYDRRGHTRSGLGIEPESVATHAADVAALIEALELARPVVVGSSGGARIAVELARTRPELLAGAVFSEPPRPTDPPLRWMPSSAWPAQGYGPGWTRPPRTVTGPTRRCCSPSSRACPTNSVAKTLPASPCRASSSLAPKATRHCAPLPRP